MGVIFFDLGIYTLTFCSIYVLFTDHYLIMRLAHIPVAAAFLFLTLDERRTT